MGILAIEMGRKGLDWVLAHWRESGWVVAVLFFYLWTARGQELGKCNTDLDTAEVKLAFVLAAPTPGPTVVAKATGHARAAVVFPKTPGVPQPCPDVTLDTDTLALVEAALKQPIPAAPAPKPEAAPYWGIELSASAPTRDFSMVSVGGSLLAGPWRAGLEYEIQGGPRILLARRWMLR